MKSELLNLEIPCPHDCGGALALAVAVDKRRPATRYSPAEPARIEVWDIEDRFYCECQITDGDLDAIPQETLWDAVPEYLQ